MTTNRSALRQTLRDRRRALSLEQQHQAAQSLCQQLCLAGLLNKAQHIAFYLPSDGEIDPRPFIHHVWAEGKSSYLPVIQADSQLNFRAYSDGCAMQNNRFGIPEPLDTPARSPSDLDIVLMPLVGFDRLGGRLGMGGGFYDRSFSFINEQTQGKRPQLIGLAHSLQEADQIDSQPWDVPMDMIVTEGELIIPAGRSKRDLGHQ